MQDFRTFQQMGAVLFIAAHPDDENTQLITYLARGRGYRTAYLSVTRGDGGQNLLGGELFEQLGVIRTQELLAARRLDGGQQFFTRAIDFGYSKHVAETLRIWDQKELIGDVVRVIRTFRPDVVITRFNPDTDNTHGHHTASAVLAREAFKLSGDPNAYSEQLQQGLTIWQPKRIFFDGQGNQGPVIRIEIGGNDAISGETFGAIAGRSRAMHKTQGFDRAGGRGFGGRGGGTIPPESFTLLAGEPATNDILDGVDTTWSRYKGGEEITRLTNDAIANFKPNDPAAAVPALLAIRTRFAGLADDRVVNEKRRQLDRIIQNCIGLIVQTSIPSNEIVPGESIKMHMAASVKSDQVKISWVSSRFPSIGSQADISENISAGATAQRDVSQILPIKTDLTQPYWLREPGTVGLFHVDDPTHIGLPENPPVFPIIHTFDVGGQKIEISDEPVQVVHDSAKGETRLRLNVIPPISLHFASDVRLFEPGQSKLVQVEAIAHRADISGTAQLDLPNGWKAEPSAQDVKLGSVGQSTLLAFNVTAPAQPAKADIGAHVSVAGQTYNTDRIDIRYNHVPPLLLQPRAVVKAVALDLKARGKTVGYLQGAGDSVSECLEQMGYTVTQLTGADLNPEKFNTFDAVVLGIRAFETRTDVVANIPAIFTYIENGGTVIVQYNRADADPNNRGTFGPLKLVQSGQRITDETAEMTFLAPDHPALNTPNKITQADFDGWMQERGIYYPSQWDEKFTPILAAHDPGEQPLNGGLLVANYGKGHLVYTGLVFFRELPEGVPGAYRLFANLLSLGK
ncbi:MAG TPA: PIG-L family deacetylase [Tepidisphaeraceae bacterium]|nr:PIG-L family deacetylase [Tepidisphaeraceae bacterium]